MNGDNNFIINDILDFIKTKKITGYEIQQKTNGEITQVAIDRIVRGKTKRPQNSTIKTLEKFLYKNYGYLRAEYPRELQSSHADEMQSHQVKYSREEEASWGLKKIRAKYGKSPEVKSAACSGCQQKERVMQLHQKQIEVLEDQITDLKTTLEHMLSEKDKQIEDLKSNLERIIASKDEILSMKEEAINGKNEIVRIQSKRIAELESHKELEEAKKIYLEQTMSENVMPSERGLLPDVVRIEEKKSHRPDRPNL